MRAGSVRRWPAAVALLLLVAGCGAAPEPGGSPPVRSEQGRSEQGGSEQGGSEPGRSEPDRDGPATVYAHLGDSYAAGVGAGPLVADSPFACQRTQADYGQVLARREGWALTDVSCAGARTENLARGQYLGVGPQLDALGPQTRVVTLTLGGNDGDVFATAVGECTRLGRTDPGGAPCRAALGPALRHRLDSRTRPDLEAGLTRIRARAPHARVLITGYPWLLPPDGGCFALVPVAAGDVPFLRRLQQDLNDAIAAAARGAGAEYVDLSGISAGHDACAGAQRWIEPMRGGPGSLHPNAAGQRAVADAVAAVLHG